MYEYGQVIEPAGVRFERLVPGPIERVWEYLTDGEKRAKWLGAGDVPNQVGAIFETRWNNSQLGSRPGNPPEKYKGRGVHTGKYRLTIYEPPHRLGFTWDETSGDQSSQLLFELKSQGNMVLLALTHSQLKTRKDRLGVSGGWHAHIDLLTDILSGRDPGSFWENFDKIDGSYENRIPQ